MLHPKQFPNSIFSECSSTVGCPCQIIWGAAAQKNEHAGPLIAQNVYRNPLPTRLRTILGIRRPGRCLVWLQRTCQETFHTTQRI